MRMLRTIIVLCFLLSQIGTVRAAESTGLSVETDIQQLRYRVVLHLEAVSSEYDELDLIPSAPGLAPRGARVRIKDRTGQLIPCANTERGYSSAELSSGSPVFKTSFKKAPQSHIVYSDWFAMGDLVRGLEQCSRVRSEKWASLRIGFTVRTSGTRSAVVHGESTWVDVSLAGRHALVTR